MESMRKLKALKKKKAEIIAKLNEINHQKGMIDSILGNIKQRAPLLEMPMPSF